MIERTFEDEPRLTSAHVAAFTSALRSLGRVADGAGELVEQLRCLEELKSAAAAAQARVATAFATTQVADQKAAGVPVTALGKGVAAQVALARRDSPHRGSRHLGLAQALTRELPHTLAALEAGHISEWRATLIARETACLSAEDRREVDAELAARPGGLGEMGDRAVAAEARRIGYRLDPHAVTNRAAKAAAERRVGLRPAPDTMTWLGALLPAVQGVAAYAALCQAADSARAAGDPRTRGQVMADSLVERLTGQDHASSVPVEVQLVMSDHALLDGDSEPAELQDYGPLPAPLARAALRADDSSEAKRAKSWLRRLYASPDGTALIAMDTRRRCFDGQLRRFLIAADRRCRTPWCDAPIRHLDHSISVAHGGKTTAANGQGLCEACNYARESQNWRAALHPTRVVDTITPTGHRYTSHPPPAIGSTVPGERASPPKRLPAATSVVEERLRELIRVA
jgi:hypothetical protein